MAGNSLLIRDMRPEDIEDCCNIIQYHWGRDIALSARGELEEMFLSNSKWPPHYYVAEEGNKILGFGGFRSSWLMSNTFELIWINVAPEARGKGIGEALTWHRLAEIRRRGGNLILLMTQKPSYFEYFQFQTVATFDGWCLMVNQFDTVKLDIDRTKLGPDYG
jgi:ribosomal protein S18 acetylase RimI-like enzyme